MTQPYREDELDALKGSETWGLCATDAFGMGMDLPDIKLIIQWKATCDFCTLWQRFGRAARGRDQEAIALLLVEKKDTDEAHKKKEERAEKARQKRLGNKRKEPTDGHHDAQSSKRPALLDRRQNSSTNEVVINSAADGDESDTEDGEMGMAIPEVHSSRVADNDEERRLRYLKIARSAASVPTSKQERGVEFGSAMDDYINAKDRGISCRRVVPTLYFGNDKTPTDDSKHCNLTLPNGCTRCAPKTSSVCCDLCHPSHLSRFDLLCKKDNVRASQKSSIKPFEMTSRDRDLKVALLNWRREQAITKFGSVLVRTYGPNVFMSDEIVERIVICAHADKLKTAAHILKETHWCEDWVDEHADSLLALIKSYSIPLSVSTSTQESILSPPTTTLNVPMRQRTPPKCSRCRQEGHIASNKNCPAKLANRSTGVSPTINPGPATRENIPPPFSTLANPRAANATPSYPTYFTHANTPHNTASGPSGLGRPIPPHLFYYSIHPQPYPNNNNTSMSQRRNQFGN